MIVIAGVGYSTNLNNGFSFRQERLIEANLQFGWDGLIFNQDCANAFPQLAGEHCNLSKRAEPTIALLGDSHSNALYPGLAQAADSNDDVVVNFARGGCTPFFDVSSFERGKTDYCADYTNRALEFSENHPSVRTIVLSSRGPLYITGKGYNEGYDWVLTSPDAPNAANFSEVFEAGMRKTFSRLSKSGKTIIFVIDVPEMGFNPRACVPARPWSITGKPKDPCAIPRSEYDLRNTAYRAIVEKVAASFPTVKVVDPSRILCDDEYCWAMRDGKLAYRDDDHLSVFGSSIVAQQIFSNVSHGVAAR
ncbi:SGNH hydrolase domain-containing protein [Achromobacter sp. NPDC058515]|uniref:SGNH hydrolase domain-containing protein n=1 Tax=Achromobacter sp. NPDC058515 TaxID=3346533 RepID=UPI00365EE07D